MDETQESTVMGSLKWVEIEKVVELSKFDEFKYKKEVEDRKNDVMSVIKNVGDDVVLKSVNDHGKVLKIMENLKDMLISDGEHDDKNMFNNINDEMYAERNNMMIGHIFTTKRYISKTLISTIESLLSVAEIHWLNREMDLAAVNYGKVADIVLKIEELNKFIKQEIKTEENSPNDQILLPSRKRGPEKENEAKPPKIEKLEVALDPPSSEDKEAQKSCQIKTAETNWKSSIKQSIQKKKNSLSLPISLDAELMTRFVVNVRELQATGKFNATMTMEKIYGFVENLHSTIESFSKVKRNTFEMVGEDQEALFEAWEKNINEHIGICNALLEMGSSSNELTIRILKLTVDRPPMRMHFLPVFKDPRQYARDGFSNDLIMKNLREALDSQGLGILSTNQELVENISEYINNLERLRCEVFDSYVRLISYFQSACTQSITDLNTTSDTLICEHTKSFNKLILIDEKLRKEVKQSEPCLICSTRYSLTHLICELGVRKDQEKSTIEQFLAKLFEEHKKLHPDAPNFSEEFRSFVNYIERLRRTADSIQIGCAKIVKYSDRLKLLYKCKNRITIERLRNYNQYRYGSDDDLKKFYLTKFAKLSNRLQNHLNTTCSDFRYHITLFNRENSGDETDRKCPICLEHFANKSGFVSFVCGHRVCQTCYPRFRNQCEQRKGYMMCVKCRRPFTHGHVIMAREKMNRTPDLIDGIRLTTKFEETLKLIKEILESDEENAIVLFTNVQIDTIESIKKYIVDVFKKAKIHCSESASRFSKECRLLLRANVKSIDLTGANHVIFLDPTDSFSFIQKALSQVIRYGQKREVKVYHMGVAASVDVEYRRICKSGIDWKVGDVRKIFGISAPIL